MKQKGATFTLVQFWHAVQNCNTLVTFASFAIVAVHEKWAKEDVQQSSQIELQKL
jgi:hypothetical protein